MSKFIEEAMRMADEYAQDGEGGTQAYFAAMREALRAHLEAREKTDAEHYIRMELKHAEQEELLKQMVEALDRICLASYLDIYDAKAIARAALAAYREAANPAAIDAARKES